MQEQCYLLCEPASLGKLYGSVRSWAGRPFQPSTFTRAQNMLCVVRFPTHLSECEAQVCCNLYLGISVGLDEEISPFGLRSIIIEPGYFQTEIASPGKKAEYPEDRLFKDYDDLRTKMGNLLESMFLLPSTHCI